MEEDSQSKLKYFPVMMFAITMGFGGLTIDYKKAVEVLAFPPVLYQILSMVVATLACVIFGFYLLKLLKYPRVVLGEFSHPVKLNFFATISMSILLFSSIFHEIANVSFALFTIGAIFQIFIAFYAITYWINRDIEFSHSNPAWFVPVVGNLLVPTTGADFVSHPILMFFFSLGLFFWIVLTAVLFNRIIFHGMLAQKFLPTLAIFIAPPAIAMTSYLRINGDDFDYIAEFLLNVAIIFAIILFALARNFYKIKFFISWWAFTFPFAALTLALLVAYEKTQFTPYYFLSFFSLVLTSCIIAFVGIKTIQVIMRDELCKEE